MQKLILILFVTFIGCGLSAQTVLEDFEGGVADLNWEAFEGVYDGPVANPQDTTINTSGFAGSYTKAEGVGFSFFRARVDTPLDLSTNNQFSIQIYAGAATQLLLKLEGDGEAIERTVNIATPNVWREYTFDFSDAAAFTNIVDIILFFDPGVEASADTYLFDNIIASPAGDCAGTVADPTILDDFECQRNATYGVPGFDDIMVVANPDVSGINTSTQVAEYTDREGAFHALVIDYNGSIDLSVNNQLCLKVWAPVTGNLLFKIEGGLSAAFEMGQPVEETNTWVEVCQDFSSQSGGDYGQITLFFNAGVDDADGDIYYLDDITLTPAPPAEALEDFEDGANLSWTPLNGDNALHGTFDGPIANPDMMVNESANVGSYTRGSSNFSTLTASLPAGIDLTGNPQLNLDVWAPDGATTVTLQLVSALEGVKSIEVSLNETMSWQTLNFNFEAFADVSDFSDVNILFDPNTSGTGLYYFDNLAQGISTVDACVDVPTDEDVFDDFECQRNASYTCCIGIEVVNNPDITPANPSPSVGAVTDPPGAFDALVIDNVDPFDFTLKNRVQAKIWSPVAGQILFKLEGGPNPVVETFVDIPATNEWIDYEVDFSGAADQGHTRLVFFFGAGGDNAEANTYFIDDIQVARAPFRTDCVVTFESEDLTISSWQYFANGDFEGNPFLISDNPSPSMENMSDKVGTFEEAANGEEFAGMFADSKAPVILPTDNKIVTMKWLMPVAGDIVIKLEGGPEEMPQSGDIFAAYTTPGEWQELTFDMSVLPDDAAYNRFTLIPNFGVIPMENQTIYFDDIAVGGGDCGAVGIFNPVVIPSLDVYPNPVGNELTIENPGAATTFRLTNMMGQRVKTLRVEGARTRVQWEVGAVPVGTYVLTAEAANGSIVARSMIVKQ